MIEIRQALESEAIELTNLAIRSKASWGYSEDFLEACRNELTISARDFQTHHLRVAVIDGMIVGFFQLIVNKSEAELSHLFVEPDYLKQGIGRRLLEDALSLARALKVGKVTLDSDPNSKAFYQHLGAATIGLNPSRSVPGRVLPAMEFNLPIYDS
jgi:GNAT superfamily N-acetyltransferase